MGSPANTLRVLRVIARLNVGGPARHVTLLDAGLRARGFDTLLAFGAIGPGEASLESLIEDTGIPAVRIRDLGRRVSPLSDIRALASLVRLIFRFRPDVVHTHTAKAGTLGRLAAALYNATRPRAQRCLVVHTFHGHVLHGYFSHWTSVAVRAVERALARLTDGVLVLSPRQQHDIVDRFRVAPRKRVQVVPLGLDLATLLALPHASAGDRAPVVFGYVGRFVPIKNLPLLLESFAAAHAEAPGTRLLLAGDGESRRDAEGWVASRGLQDAVQFVGWQHDLAALYRSIDVLVLTSLNEGTPVAAIEAMAAAVPVISTDVGGVGDVVLDERTGLLAPSGAADQLSRAMLRLARSAEERSRLGLAGRQMVAARFTAERLVSDMSDIYRRELARKRRTPPPAAY